jgi:WD40 repeat protein
MIHSPLNYFPPSNPLSPLLNSRVCLHIHQMDIPLPLSGVLCDSLINPFLSDASLVIWDIQTGGVAKEIPYDEPLGQLVWSLDGKTVSTVVQGREKAVHTYDITSGARLSPGELYSGTAPHLWAHDTSLLAMTTQQDGQTHMINIFEIGAVLNKIKSFHINLGTKKTWVNFLLREKEKDYQVRSFSPATHRISMHAYHQLLILDVRNSECLLKQSHNSHSHCFSSDGSLFAASFDANFHVWKYASGKYSPWREFPSSNCELLCFSPTLSSILGRSQDVSQVWRLDGPPIIAHPDSDNPLATFSPCGTYVVTGYRGKKTITITNLHSQAPPNIIDTGMKIDIFTLTGNLLLVEDFNTIAAWQLTEEGEVDGVSGNRRANHHNSIWTTPQPLRPPFSNFAVDQTVTVQDGAFDGVIHVYHTGTREVVIPTQAPLQRIPPWTSVDMYYYGCKYPHCYELDECNACPKDGWPVSCSMFQEVWVKDPEGKHRLWIPAKWRKHEVNGSWLYNITTLNLGDIIIKF